MKSHYIKMSDYVEMTPKARWLHLRENGPKTTVELQSNDNIQDKPDWFDEERFVRAKEMINKYFIG